MTKRRWSKLAPWAAFFAVCLGIFLFYLCCARLLVKTDDGHFLGVLHQPDFALTQWLRQRYATNSGRTVSEGLMMTFLRQPLLLWKAVSAVLLCAVLWFLCKLALAFPGGIAAKDKISFASAAGLLALPTCMSAGAFWFAGSFTYLWPMAGLVLCAAPVVFLLLNVPHRPWLYAVSFLAAPLAASEEQAAAAVIALLLCVNAFLLIRKRWRWQAALPLLPACVCAYFLFSSPGARLRNLDEAKSSFPAFLEMSFFEKLAGGFSNYFAYAFFLSIPVMTLFLLLLYRSLRQCGVKKSLLAAHGICWGVLCLGGNLLCFGFRQCIPDQLFETRFAASQPDAFGTALLAMSALFFLSVLFLLVLLVRRRMEIGLAAGLCFAAAVGCGVAPGLSGSLYASGQRIFFFSELFILAAAVILYGNADDTKHMRALHIGVIALAAGFAVFHTLGFKLLEIPPMG